MKRFVLVLSYLAASAFAVVLFDAHTGNEQLELVAWALWGLASISLGWGTGQPLWSLLAAAVIAFAVPFGPQNPPVYHEAAITFMFAAFFGVVTAALIAISALGRMLVEPARVSAS